MLCLTATLAAGGRDGSLCDIHRCPLYGFRGHSGHQPSELSARPPSLAISLPVALLGGLDLGGLLLFKFALPLLGLGNLPSVILEDAAVALFDVCPRRRFAHNETVRVRVWILHHGPSQLLTQCRLRRGPQRLVLFVRVGNFQVYRESRCAVFKRAHASIRAATVEVVEAAEATEAVPPTACAARETRRPNQ
jgi:hypothetical protein